MTFPFNWQKQELVEADLDLFGAEFAETVMLFLPCLDVHFVGPQSGGELDSVWKAGVEMVRNEQKPVVDSDEEEHLYLPLWTGESLLGVAILKSSAGTYSQASTGWLLDKSRLISREMGRVKQYLLDSVTGLPGGQAFNKRLQVIVDRGLQGGEEMLDFSLSLLEIHPRARDGQHALASIARSGAFLDSLIGHLFTPCHLGNGIFGLIWQNVGEEQALKMADMLLRWLKREGFPRCRIGVRSFVWGEENLSCDALFEQAWQALRIAGKRGPFALCSHQAVSNRSAHPLCPPGNRVLASLRKLWKDDKSFALALLHQDQDGKSEDLLLPDSLDVPVVQVNDHEAYVYFSGKDKARLDAWCKEIQTWAAGKSVSFSIGAALYPEADFKKKDIPANCRKALLHTGFFGPGSTTFFDGVSLNISGDIYYNEGDLARAVKEYRSGLQLDPENVNLLNSLAVTYAKMDMYKKAVPLFREALDRDPANFMALFNLGFANLASGDEGDALVHFEKALLEQDDNFDLLLQLGKLYCKAGRHEEAVTVLRKGEQVGPVGVRDISHGAVYRFLGEAYRGLGETKKAMSCLQRATRHNPRDAASLSLLGELYCREGQGEEVALSLCRQAVDLDDSDWGHWSRLGTVLMAKGLHAEALSAVRKGLALARGKGDLLLQLGMVYQEQGKDGLARKMYKKIKRSDACYDEASNRLDILETN